MALGWSLQVPEHARQCLLRCNNTLSRARTGQMLPRPSMSCLVTGPQSSTGCHMENSSFGSVWSLSPLDWGSNLGNQPYSYSQPFTEAPSLPANKLMQIDTLLAYQTRPLCLAPPGSGYSRANSSVCSGFYIYIILYSFPVTAVRHFHKL